MWAKEIQLFFSNYITTDLILWIDVWGWVRSAGKVNPELPIVLFSKLFRPKDIFCNKRMMFDRMSWENKINTLFLFIFFHRHAGDSPLLKLRRWYETGRTSRLILSRLPPVMIVLAYYLQDITNFEWYSSLCAWYELILQRIVVELGSNEYLKKVWLSVHALYMRLDIDKNIHVCSVYVMGYVIYK